MSLFKGWLIAHLSFARCALTGCATGVCGRAWQHGPHSHATSPPNFLPTGFADSEEGSDESSEEDEEGSGDEDDMDEDEEDGDDDDDDDEEE